MERDEHGVPPGGAPAEEPEELSFEQAEYDDPADSRLACTFCDTPLTSFYFEINGVPACESCRYSAEEARSAGTGPGRFGRAVAAGLGAAVVGALIYYAVLAITGYEVGLIALVVGFLVGYAVHWGSRGRGGIAYQLLAVGLTYVAIVSTYVPFIFQAWDEGDEAVVAEAAPLAGEVVSDEVAAAPAEESGGDAADASTGEDAGLDEVASEDVSSEDDTGAVAVEEMLDADGQIAHPEPETPEVADDLPADVEAMSAGEIVLGTVLFILFVLAVPFLAGFENIIGLAIIAFALWEAWRLNAKQPFDVAGPFSVGEPRPLAADADG